MDEKYILPLPEEIEQLIIASQFDDLRNLLARVHPADIADLMDELNADEAVTVFELLSLEAASEVLDETGSIIRQELVEKVDDERLADLLDTLPMDDAAEFLEDLPEPVSERLIGLMEPEEAAEVQEILAYEEETAGRLMTRNVAALRRQWTVNETFEFLRSLEDAETLHYLYVVDRDDRLLGVVPLRELIMARADATIESIMSEKVVAAPATADQEELAEMVARYDYYAIPVVDEDGRLLGVVTVDDVLDIFEEEVTEDIQRLGGSEPLDQPYFAVSIFQIVRKRIGWLLLLFVASTLSGEVIRYFQHELDVVVALGFFITLITGTGGNAGSQTVATIIRAITLDEVKLGNLWQAWRREVSVGLILGVVMGLVGIGRALLWGTGYEVAIVVALTLPAVVIWSTTVATIIPIVADRVKIDPTVISGPMIATIVDATGLLIYFSLAKAILDAI
ncbi:MAG: magnesium transporter [Ardenticatenaceae bacterium]|nr:magnesium transporter [Anaerolineales bacterium]MCB8921703.1 magnesium transporter [Ardenticatenaceae bacterium]MCB8990778.1 magnesium transporter [Ardenticatenaceae bacterium]MCB9003265.1 magnesium transporter [Ardenticatenaceae bacterium]